MVQRCIIYNYVQEELRMGTREVDLNYIAGQLNAGYIDISDTYGEQLEFQFVKNAVMEAIHDKEESLLDVHR